MSDWLERELARHLASVRAPEGLWDRLQLPPLPQRPRTSRFRWPVAAILTLAAASTFWLAARTHAAEPYLTARVVHAAQPQLPSVDWNLHCALPIRTSTFQLAAFAASQSAPDTVGCHQCHASVVN